MSLHNVQIIPVLSDNYAYCLHAGNGDIALIDPGAFEPVDAALTKHGDKPTHIFLTHHHADHTGGVQELVSKYGSKVIGPRGERDRLPPLDIELDENDSPYTGFGGIEIQLIATPGHTGAPLCYYLPSTSVVFTGDTLFAMGCGRLFEGTAAQMWSSLQKLSALPEDTAVYCGHEYTLANAQFCRTIEPDNDDLSERLKAVEELTKAGQPTMPSSIGLEKKTNAFLRAGSAERFAEIRDLKDKN